MKVFIWTSASCSMELNNNLFSERTVLSCVYFCHVLKSWPKFIRSWIHISVIIVIMVIWNIFDNIRNSFLTIDTVVDSQLETLSLNHVCNYRVKYIFLSTFVLNHHSYYIEQRRTKTKRKEAFLTTVLKTRAVKVQQSNIPVTSGNWRTITRLHY